MSYPEAPSLLTDKAPNHQEAALRHSAISMSKISINPSIKSFKDVIGYKQYKKLWDHNEKDMGLYKHKFEFPGREAIKLLEIYGKIANRQASETQIEWEYKFILNKLNLLEKFYKNSVEGKYIIDNNFNITSGDKENYPIELLNNDDFLDTREFLNIIKNIKKLEKQSKEAKNRTDKVIFIDSFMNAVHTFGGLLFMRMWENELDSFDEYVKKYLDYLRNNR